MEKLQEKEYGSSFETLEIIDKEIDAYTFENVHVQNLILKNCIVHGKAFQTCYLNNLYLENCTLEKESFRDTIFSLDSNITFNKCKNIEANIFANLTLQEINSVKIIDSTLPTFFLTLMNVSDLIIDTEIKKAEKLNLPPEAVNRILKNNVFYHCNFGKIYVNDLKTKKEYFKELGEVIEYNVLDTLIDEGKSIKEINRIFKEQANNR